MLKWKHVNRLLVGALSFLILSGGVTAGWFGSEGKKPETLIVTGNYLKSRLLAEIIQRETKQPILLLPSGENTETLYFLHHDNEKNFKLDREEYQEFVELLYPKTVVFLGDERYAPQEYVDLVSEGLVVSVFRHSDWMKIADSVGQVLQIDDLREDYEDYLSKYDYKGRVIQGEEKVLEEWEGGDPVPSDNE